MRSFFIAFIAILPCLVMHQRNCYAQTESQARKIVARYDVNALKTTANRLQVQRTALRQEAVDAGFKIKIEQGDASAPQGAVYAELQAVTSDGKPVYYKTLNAAAAQSTRTNFLHPGGGLGLGLTGENLTIFVWDGGTARINHREFSGRVSVGDVLTGYNGLGSDHATHVTGTLVAGGLDANARGMAFGARAKSFEWNNDTSEVAIQASNGMLISNHSYGYSVPLPASYFGGYLSISREWDEIMFSAPNYLMVVAAGNDGSDDTANTSPLNGASQFDKLTGHCVSKNGLVVANAKDVDVTASGEILGMVEIVDSSSQGPTDDLRVKPDISGNGYELRSTLHSGFNGNNGDKYGQTGWTGTSMASPNVAGSLLLLQQLYEKKNGDFMRSATLKGLALHTANDSGAAGPDSIFGWGLLNAKRAAEVVIGQNASSIVLETSISQGGSYKTKFKAKGLVQVSISWTDPAGTAVTDSVINSTTPVLVNDLDLRVTRQGSSLMPWKLVSHSSNARGDNKVDPFERIDDSSPSIAEYEITVSHKGSLQNGSQNFSLIVTGDSLEQQSPLIADDQIIRNQNEIGAIQDELKTIAAKIQEIANRLDGQKPLQFAPPKKSDMENILSRFKDLQMRNKIFSPRTKGTPSKEDVEMLRSLLERMEQDPNAAWMMDALKPDIPSPSPVPAYGLKPGIGTPEGSR